MFKKILTIFFFCFVHLHAEIVNEIEISGNKRISKEAVVVYGEIEKNADYSSDDLNNILKNLYSTEFFENVSVSLKNNTLIIVLKEYPLLNSIELNGESSKQVKEQILEMLNLKEKESFLSFKLNDDINLIKKIYRSLGFNFVSVNAKINDFSENRVNLLFEVEKGQKTFIKKINFIGDKKIRDSKLRDIITSEEHKFWKILSKNTFFNSNNIELDKRLLLNYYKSLGYYDVQILSSDANLSKNDDIILTYTINAGTRYKINKISSNIQDIIDKKYFIPLQDLYLDYVGEYYSPFKVKKILDSLDLLIAENQLQFIEHSVNEIIENENIEIKINIFEGQKQTVEKINVYGNTVTNESVIRAELLLDEGDPFSPLKFDQSISKLKARNIFGEINTSIVEGSSKEQKILNITVEEKPTGEISAGAGIGTNGGSFAFNVTENNWLGKGINLATNLELSSETFTGALIVTEPNYNFSGNSLNYFVKNIKNDKPDSGFKNDIYSIGIGTKFEQYKDLYLSPNISFSYDDLKVESTASTMLKKQKGTFSDLSFDYGITNDKRDRVYGTTDGHLTFFSQVLPLYADAPFIKNSFSHNIYHSFSPDKIGSIKFYTSAITGLNNEDVRLSKRILLGSSRLRGFEAGKVGPKDGNDYIGGNYAAVTNFELNLPKLLPESTNIDIGAFLDVGSIWGVDYDSSLDDSNKIRSTVGINTSWMSPVGPLTFVFSQNISKASTDVTESFNFRLGTTF